MNTQVLGLRGALVLWAAFCGASAAQEPLSVKEIAIFKDGNAFLRAEGERATTPDGVATDADVPPALLGSFWPYVPTGGPRLLATAAGKTTVRVAKTALTPRELIAANPGAEVIVSPGGDQRLPGVVLGVPARSVEERRRTQPASEPTPLLPEESQYFLLRTADGVRTYPLDRAGDVTFRQPPKTTYETSEVRDALHWRLDPATVDGAKAVVGYACLVKGFRWSPSYRVELDGKGGAVVTLSAVLANDFADLVDATAHFVVGAPRLDFADEFDPMALESNVRATLDASFQNAAFNNPAQFLNNRAQVVLPGREGGGRGGVAGEGDLPAERAEDLYVFTAKGVTLARGARLSLKLAEWRVRAQELHRLHIPAHPPAEVAARADGGRDEIARLAALPKVMRYLRLANDGAHPFTTGPASFFREGRLIGQGLLTYTAPGGESETALAAAVEIRVRRDDRRLDPAGDPASRTVRRDGAEFRRSESEGVLTVVNHSPQAIELEVRRDVYGAFDSVEEGRAIRLDWIDAEAAVAEDPAWWRRYGWGAAWRDLNGVGRATWARRIEPGKTATFSARWHVYVP
jgi:hypothetical protein